MYASAWSLVGSRFDLGGAYALAMEEKERMLRMLQENTSEALTHALTISRSTAGQIHFVGPDGDYFDPSRFVGAKLYAVSKDIQNLT